ncbi:MAG TPA: NAD(P)-binding protein [Ferrovibrio sp.]|uniref:NAD(P)-binding protein n=1 Tax=Ferrovibrio sp. TaxID=1917215 RepID=UPI002ED33034
MLHHIAIIGSGPSGLFCADALLRQRPDLKIDVFDRLPTPYGLIRFGVAPDHQGTKAVTRQFDRLFGGGSLRFIGNVAVGADLPLGRLSEHYDAVVLALGAHADRALGIPGEDLPGRYGSMAFVGWYNGHPDFRHLDPLLDAPGIAVIGMGNVAVDIVRVLGKTPAEMTASDLCVHAAEVIAAAPVTDLYIIGRRGPAEASFTSAELAELGRLERVRPIVEKADLPDGLPSGIDPAEAKIKEKNLQILHDFAARTDDRPVKLHFLFHSIPEAVLGQSRVEGLKLKGRAAPLSAGTVISAIGYRTAATGDLPQPNQNGIIPNDNGRVAPGLYVVGWAKRGPSGTIPTNRLEAKSVADRMLADFADDTAPAKSGSAALDTWLRQQGLTVIDWPGWKRIEAAEIAAARQGSPREKLADWAGLRQAALPSETQPAAPRAGQQ